MIDSNTGISELSLTIFQNTLETNSFGPLLLSQACLALMKANNYGRIVNLSSTLGSLTDIVSPVSPNKYKMFRSILLNFIIFYPQALGFPLFL